MSKKLPNIKPEQGKILISEPFLQDYYFGRSVVLLVEHNIDGSLGLIVNKPLEIKLSDVIRNFPAFDAGVYLGGPVSTDSLYFLHTLGDKIPLSQEIVRGLYWGGDIDMVRDMILAGSLSERDIRFFIGYSGWSPNQLHEELERDSWVVKRTTARSLLAADPSTMWGDHIRSFGKEYAIWANFPENPSLN